MVNYLYPIMSATAQAATTIPQNQFIGSRILFPSRHIRRYPRGSVMMPNWYKIFCHQRRRP
jgi:hypothetical protein